MWAYEFQMILEKIRDELQSIFCKRIFVGKILTFASHLISRKVSQTWEPLG